MERKISGAAQTPRTGFVGIIVEDRAAAAAAVNAVLSEFADVIRARLGIPGQGAAPAVITLVVETDTARLGALAGRLGAIPGVSVKSALAKIRPSAQ
ncbi:MAG: CopG family transcriptional regulator [Kiritimatiellae bacterium]|nr:CopG family transcriptional regulator [Kiritimatiellia bacterium]